MDWGDPRSRYGMDRHVQICIYLSYGDFLSAECELEFTPPAREPYGRYPFQVVHPKTQST